MKRLVTHALLTASGFSAVANHVAPGDSWTHPREIGQFQFLLDRSPFSLPTAEESSPLADRFSLTGAVGLDGEALVFVLDKNTQTRHMVSKEPNSENIGLVEFLPDPDPRRMRATIRVNGEIATISYAEPTADPNAMASGHMAPGQMPQIPNGAAISPPVPGTPNLTAGGTQPQPPPRRVIRRRIISGQTGP